MAITKEKVQNIIDHMPESFQADDLIERIVIMQNIEVARQEIKDEQIISEEEMDKFIDSLE